MIFRYLYVIFLGILLALFVGIGVATFYAEPQPPKSNPIPPISVPGKGSAMDIQSQQAAYREEMKQQKQFEVFQADIKVYSRNVSMVVMVAAVGYLLVSLFLFSRFPVWSDGFLFGGLFTLIYSIGRGLDSDDSKFRFLVITLSLIIVMVVGYLKFIRMTSTTKKSGTSKRALPN